MRHTAFSDVAMLNEDIDLKDNHTLWTSIAFPIAVKSFNSGGKTNKHALSNDNIEADGRHIQTAGGELSTTPQQTEL